MFMIGPLWRYFWVECRSVRVNSLNNKSNDCNIVYGMKGGREEVGGGETKGSGRGRAYRITPSALHRCSPDQMRRPVLVNDNRVEASKSYLI